MTELNQFVKSAQPLTRSIVFNFLPVESVPDYSKLTLTQTKRLEMESQVGKLFLSGDHLGYLWN